MIDPTAPLRAALTGRMRCPAVLLLLCTCVASSANAQGLTTGGVRGSVRDSEGRDLDGAAVRVVNTATGFVVRAQVVGGRFIVQGLEPGGPYVVEVRQIGFRPQQSAPVHLTLGEPLSIAFVLEPAVVELEAIEVRDTASSLGGGPGTTIPEALVRRLPTLNRNFQD